MINAVDLFCGAGGTSSGLLLAGRWLHMRIKLLAVNHWLCAVNTHRLNHPNVRHLCENVENIHPLDQVPSGHLQVMLASCECRYHANARGGGPCNEQSRSQAWQLIRWATDIEVDNIMMENVREFLHWGPLHRRTKRPIKSRRGEFFRTFVATLRGLGYTVDWRIQTAADFGDPTRRQRLILIARKGRQVTWPEPTHGPSRTEGWHTARECIDFSLPSRDVMVNGAPRYCANTMRRIKAGFKKQGANAKPFLAILRGTSSGHLDSCSSSLDKPMPSITASGNHLLLCEPFIINTDQTGGNGDYVQDLNRPLGSIVTKQNMLLIQPMILKYYKSGICKPIDEPLDTITTKARFMLLEPKVGKNGVALGVRARMVQPRELANAHSFPASYIFTGNKAEQTKQIGNSVPVLLAAAHARMVLS